MCKYPLFRDFMIEYINEVVPNNDWDEVIRFSEEFAERSRGTPDLGPIMAHVAFHKVIREDFDESHSILQQTRLSQDALTRFYCLHFLCSLYSGWNNPAIDSKKLEDTKRELFTSLDNIESGSEFEERLNDFEKTYMEYQWNSDIYQQQQLIPVLRELLLKIPFIGENYRAYFEINFANVYYHLGDFEEYIKCGRIHSKYYKVGQLGLNASSYQYHVAIIKGDLLAARKYIEDNKHRTQDVNLPNALLFFKEKEAEVFELEGKFTEAQMVWKEIEELSERLKTPLSRFKQINNKFDFYFRHYSLFNDHDDYDQLQRLLIKQQDFVKNYSEDVTMNRLTALSEAKLLKFGTIKDRYRAIIILEELKQEYPQNLEINKLLIELYLSDLSTDQTGETQRYIEGLLDEMENHPQMNNPLTLWKYSIYHIILAKYRYYLCGDVDHALQILYDILDLSRENELLVITKEVEKEIQLLELELEKWRQIDLSVRDRLVQSKIERYIKRVGQFIQSGHIPDLP